MTNETNMNNPVEAVEPSAPQGVARMAPGRAFLLGVATVLALVAVVGAWAGVAGTRRLSRHPAVVRFATVLKIPVARVNGAPILYRDYVRDVDTLAAYYANAGAGDFAPTAEQVSDQVLSRLAVNALVQGFAKEYAVSVSRGDADSSEMLAQILASFPTREAAEEELRKRYGWTFDQYVERVVLPILLEQKLETAFTASADDSGKAYEEEQVRASHILFSLAPSKSDARVKAEAERVLARIKNGEDFAKLAAEFGSDGTKDAGGDLGWFGRGRMVPEFETAAFALGAGELSPSLVKTQFGYHIIKTMERRTARDYSRFIDDQLRQATVEILVPIHNPFATLPAEDAATTTARG